MENNFLWFSILLSLIVLKCLILNVGKRLKSKSSDNNTTSKLPPGPWKLPIIGSIHHMIGSLPHHSMRELSQKYGPLMHLKLGETSAIVVSSKEIAKEVLKTNEITFPQRPRSLGLEIVSYGCTDIAFSPYGEYWRQLRKICTLELLSVKRVRSYQSIREEEVSKLIRYISINTGSTINLTDEILSLTYSITSRASFGDNCKDNEAYILFMKESMSVAESFSIHNLFPSQHWLHVISGMVHKLKRLHRSGDMFLQNIINNKVTKKTSEDGSLLSYLLNLKHDASNPDGFHLTINNIKAVIQTMLIGGSETSSLTIQWAFSEMLKNPRVMKKAQEEVRQAFGSRGYVDEKDLQELKYLKAVIKETLRVHPPNPVFPRECIETCEINGYTIPAGTQVFVNAWAIGRDQKYWIEGEKFYPERFLDSSIDFRGSNFEFIPFGAGKRMCPGISFAASSIELPLAQLLYSFDWKLPSGTTHENFDMTESFGATVKRKSDLFVIPIPYNP
ncbi:putative premnaspirodiene oxygenase [Medicago truncatula]|uniref:Cytochrome P450 family 71 protein n=1 Tax=Medicago truncatula TaxID=3880 RepID=G7K4L5_MEDTR|nr:cytochrome P450 71D11 [Medicago truncatula]AET00731.1 cytochrome P450 family 71 protein [Medicago truncatula]RHN57973.1 putative premnaspirodiene oxygenase [Medicago truncatula]